MHALEVILLESEALDIFSQTSQYILKCIGWFGSSNKTLLKHMVEDSSHPRSDVLPKSQETSLGKLFRFGVNASALIGLAVTARFVGRSWRYIYSQKSPLVLRYGTGSWAIVTGATNGIGKSFSQTLAREGFNVVLVGRDASALQTSQEEIQANHPNVQVKTTLFNFSSQHEIQEYGVFEEITQGFDVSLFVSCAGVSQFDRYHETNEEALMNLIRVNVTPSLLITRKIIPSMLTRSKRSGLIYVSSYTAMNEMPYVSAYAGTKGFLDAFSRSLGLEYQNKLDILALNPYYVSTKMTRYMKPSLETVTTEQLVSQALKDLGKTRQSVGSFNHFLVDLLYKLAPKSWSDRYKLQKMDEMLAQQDRMKKLRKRSSRKNSE